MTVPESPETTMLDGYSIAGPKSSPFFGGIEVVGVEIGVGLGLGGGGRQRGEQQRRGERDQQACSQLSSHPGDLPSIIGL